MIKIQGSYYVYQGEVLTKPEVIFVQDHHYHEEDRCFYIKQLLDNSTCNPYDHTLIMDHVLQHDDELKGYNILRYPSFLGKQVQLFINENIIPNWSKRKQCFNFMINKPRFHREFLLVLIEHFKLTNYNYTLCWKKPAISTLSLSNLTEKYKQLILDTPVTIDTKNFLLGQENLLDRGLQYKHIQNSKNYQKFLQKEVFEPSCISVITEPAFFEKETIITEKTIMSIYSGTLPIWVGGWRCADIMRNYGFDVFDDIIDHSYQNMEDPFDRCYYAIERNIDLLRDFERANNFVQNNRVRFEHNLQLLKDNVFQKEVDKININML
jgi:hypothetical protein